ncbi:YpmS family protein [Enterococcus sp. BWR-S5]|uniref:YpmS family protein n=1 Tax=Enterococcus sp. BWR-S5 TaxID=2787714 RepID=UPI001923B41D|nr:YpmS family protein [Enterococcus sp. BWR-S5]MBL1224644.1 YpmS family protein [Enterococcus sp. BWR-S5]
MAEETEKQQPEKKRKRNKQLKNDSTGKKINPWKIAFLAIIGVLAGIVLFIGIRVTQVREPDFDSSKAVQRSGNPVLTIQSNKQQINELIDFYLEDFQKGSEVTYDFYLENEAMLTGSFKILGHPIQFNLYFDPYVMDDGNVQLKAKSLSIGTLGLPIRDILASVQRDYKLPEWVEVMPEEKYILLRLDKFQMQNGLFIRADKINLIDDDIRVSIYLPEEATSNSSETTETSSSEN